MPDTYNYRVRDRSGNLIKGTLEADSEPLVLQRLREMGYTPLEVQQEKKKVGQIKISIRPGRVKLKALSIFCRQFATMVNSGLPILRALAILADQTDSEELAKVVTAVRVDVEQGASLSIAMGKHPKAFNNLFIAMVKSGEAGGVLDDVLLSLADMIEKEVKLRSKIKSAMTYPVAVLGLVTLIMSAMLLFVVPQFKGIYGQLGGKLPLPTQMLLSMSDGVKKYWYIVIGFVALAIFLFRRYKRTEAGRAQVDAIMLKLPVFGSLFHKTALSRFSSTLGMLLKSGVPILQALDIVSETVNNKVISRAVVATQNSVRQGESIAKPLAKHPVFPGMVVQMLAVGEETGQIDSMLAKVAEFYNAEVEAQVDALTSLIEPLLIAVIGGCVGAAVVALYMPMFNIIKLIK
ncbi:MAG TPA: type II secretion system F family protein [Actinomycetota bacterium]|jgi:type IV pilus assembly protein PilC|nr:type II secretion system F family protein [Actinomycetota bacterium]